MIESFRINISNQIIENIYDKIKKYPWNEMPNIDGWDHGTNFSYIKEISKYWVEDFNWKEQEKNI